MDRLENLFGAQASKISYLYNLKHGGKVAKKAVEEEKPKPRVSKAAGRIVYDENNKPVKVPKDLTEDQAAGRTPFTASNGKKYYLAGDDKSCGSVDYVRKHNLKVAKKAVDKIDFAKSGEELPTFYKATLVDPAKFDSSVSSYLTKKSNKSSDSSNSTSNDSSNGDSYNNFHSITGNSDSGDLSYSPESVSITSRSAGSAAGKVSDNASFVSNMNAAYKEAGISNPDLRRLLISQDALETDYGTKLAGDYNYGNITAGSSWTGDVAIMRDNGDKVDHAFRCYDSAGNYARDKVALLTRVYHVSNSDSPEVALSKINGDNPGGYRYATDPQYYQKVSSVYQSLS